MGRVNGESREIGFGLPPAEFVSLTPPGRRWEGGETLPCGGRVSVGAVAGPGRQPDREGGCTGLRLLAREKESGPRGGKGAAFGREGGFSPFFFFHFYFIFSKALSK